MRYLAETITRHLRRHFPHLVIEQVVVRTKRQARYIAELSEMLRLHPEQHGTPDMCRKVEFLVKTLGQWDPFLIRYEHQCLMARRRAERAHATAALNDLA